MQKITFLITSFLLFSTQTTLGQTASYLYFPHYVENYAIKNIYEALQWRHPKEDLAIIKHFLDNGTDVNLVVYNTQFDTNRGLSILHHAFQACLPEVIELLIQYGVDVNKPLEKTKTVALHLDPYGQPENYYRCVELLINAGADVNKADDYGFVPLHKMMRSPRLVQLLIASGAHVNACHQRGRSPLHELLYNYSRWDKESIQLLINAGSKLDTLDAHGFAPLHYAAFHSAEEVIPLLIQAGADVNQKSNANYNYREAYSFLNYQTSETKTRNKKSSSVGLTPIDCAAINWWRLYSFMFKAPFPINFIDVTRFFPPEGMVYVTFFGPRDHRNTMEILLNAGATADNVNIQALTEAVKQGSLKQVIHELPATHAFIKDATKDCLR